MPLPIITDHTPPHIVTGEIGYYLRGATGTERVFKVNALLDTYANSKNDTLTTMLAYIAVADKGLQ